MLVVLEGLDGVGKTTTAGSVVEGLRRRGRAAQLRSFERDYFPEVFSHLRNQDFPFVRYMLQKAALSLLRRDLAESPTDLVTVCDRYEDSVDALYLAWPEQNRIIPPFMLNLPIPEVPVLLHCADETRLERLERRHPSLSKRKRYVAEVLAPQLRRHLTETRSWLAIDTDCHSPKQVASIILQRILQAKQGAQE